MSKHALINDDRISLLRRVKFKILGTLRGFAGGFEIGVGTWREGDRDHFSNVGVVSVVIEENAAVGIEGPPDAAVIVHNDVRVVPLASEFDRGSIVGIQV